MSSFLQARQTSSNDHLLDLIANPFQAQIQAQAFWASFGTSLGITLLLAIIFSLLRPRHTLVYAPKIKHSDSKHAPPPMGKEPWSWVATVTKTKEQVLVDKIGTDAVVFIRFTKMLRNIFCILGVLGVAIMIPVNITTGVKFTQTSNAFQSMTPLVVFGNGLWAQIIMAYVINIVVAYFLWRNYRTIFRLRRDYLQSSEYQQTLSARTVLIRHIPRNMRSEEGMVRLTEEVSHGGPPPQAITGKNVKELPELLDKHEEAVRKLESVLAKYLKTPDRLPSSRPMIKAPRDFHGATTNGKTDAIEYYRVRIATLEQRITETRQHLDHREAMPYGFASWSSVSQAHSVAYAARNKKPQGTVIRLAPRPSDLIWRNLSLTKGTLRNKRLMNILYITILTILWTPLNAGIAIFLSNLSNLGSVWPAFQTELQKNSGFWALVQGILSPALTSLVYLLLPIIFRRLQIRAGDVTKTSRERHVLRNLYLFFVLNNLVIFSIFSAVWQYVSAVVQSSSDGNVWNALLAGRFFVTVMTSLCQISPFWVTWILQRNLGAAIDIAQLWTLFYQWFAKTFMAPTPRQHIEWTAPPSFDYASYYNYFLFYSTIALTFATLQPIILVAAAIYFVVDSILKKYLLTYVFVTKHETGGQFWRTLFNRLVFACILTNIVIGVLVIARDQYTMAGALVPNVVLMLAFKFYCMKKFDTPMHYLATTGMQDGENHAGAPINQKTLAKAAVKFRHPAFDQKLMTPMVSQKAQYLMPQIYGGRLSMDANVAGDVHDGYSDIPMRPMSNQSQQPAAYEVVPEAQEDFAYYRNRDDFRDAGGDNLYKPEDIISRTGTPASFMSGPSSYNQGYPATPYGDATPPRAQSPVGSLGVKRKAVAIHSTLNPSHQRSGSYDVLSQQEEENDVGLQPKHGRYTDPNDDSSNLLIREVGDIGRGTPTGEFMSVDRFRAGDSHTPTPLQPGGGSYDYFRGGHR